VNSPTWRVERVVPVLITGGLFVHLVNISRYLLLGGSTVSEVLLWPVDLVLAALMVFCAVALIWRRREFAAAFDVRSRARRIGYWLITFYIAASVPGHVLFLTTGNTTYFDVFPWWFSIVILPVYVAIITYFVTLRERDPGRVPAAAPDHPR
jgi:hypothetical protein